MDYAKIGDEICSCSPGKFLTTGTTKTCNICPDRKYQDELAYNGTSCTKECSVDLYLALDKSTCFAFGSDPLPNGNSNGNAADRVGSLGGAIDDYYQNYHNYGTTALTYKPSNSMTKFQVIAKHGLIETWDTSECTNGIKPWYNPIKKYKKATH